MNGREWGVWSERDIWQVVIHIQTDNIVSMKHVFTANETQVFTVTGRHEWQWELQVGIYFRDRVDLTLLWPRHITTVMWWNGGKFLMKK